MLKEIHEQPEAAIDALRGRVDFDSLTTTLDEIPYTGSELAEIDRVVFLGMGTSLNAAMVGRNWMESFARLPAEADNASEFRYRDPAVGPRTLVVSVSQSGETADTLAAMEEARRKGARQLTLCNYGGRAIHPRGGRLAAVARRPGDWRCVHQDVRVLAARALPSRAAPGQQTRRAAPATYARAHTRTGRRARPAGPSCGRRRPLHETGGQVLHALQLPVSRTRGQLPARHGGRAQAQRAELHPRRGLPGGRDETRPHLAHRREPARRRARPKRRPVRQDGRQRQRGPHTRRRRS